MNDDRERDLERELESHLDLEAEEHGGDRLAARRALGNVGLVKEDTRAIWGRAWIETTAQDLRYATRGLRNAPGFAGMVVLSLALGIGATTVVFAAVKAVLLNPLPLQEPERLIQIRTNFANADRQASEGVTFWNDLQEVAARTQTLEPPALYNYGNYNLAGDASSTPEALYGLRMDARLFPTLGVPTPLLGRGILPEDDQPGRDRVLVLSYGLWTRRFASDPGVIGRSVQINEHAGTIVGVMPEGFDFPLRIAVTTHIPSGHMDFWAPLVAKPVTRNMDSTPYRAIARLRPGVTVDQALEDLDRISRELVREFPDTNRERRISGQTVRSRTFGQAERNLWLALAAVAVFTLIGCVNVANLTLARLSSRSRELSTRLALGASPGRLVRQLFTESCLLALAGGLAGIALAAAAWRFLPSIAPFSIPRLAAARVDWPIFGLSLGVSMATAVFFGVVPAWASIKTLRRGGQTRAASGDRSLFRTALVSSQVALAVVLVLIGGLITGSFLRLIRTDPGFDSDHVLASVVLASADRYRVPAAKADLFRKIVAAVRALPGVDSAGTVDALPFTGENDGAFISITSEQISHDKSPYLAETDTVSPDYLRTMGVRLLEGRWLREEETALENTSALVNDVAAQQFWPGESAVGKRLCVECSPGKKLRWATVAGVVTTILHSSLQEARDPQVYLSAGAYERAQFLVVHTPDPSAAMDQAIRKAIASVDPSQPVFLSGSMSGFIGDSVADRRFVAAFLGFTEAIALFLASAGVFGVMSYLTARRTQEIGIRIAIGATPRDILGLVLSQGGWMTGTGMAVGLAVAFGVIELLRNSVEGLAITDAWPVGLAILAVVSATFLSCVIPARKASRTDPMSALRQE